MPSDRERGIKPGGGGSEALIIIGMLAIMLMMILSLKVGPS